MMEKSGSKDVTIKTVLAIAAIFIVSLFMDSAYPAGGANASKRLMLFQGLILSAYFNDHYVEIKRAPLFYGYGWLDHHRVFVAYQREGSAAAYAESEIIDPRPSRTNTLARHGARANSG